MSDCNGWVGSHLQKVDEVTQKTHSKYFDLIPLLIEPLLKISRGEGDPEMIARQAIVDWDKARGMENNHG